MAIIVSYSTKTIVVDKDQIVAIPKVLTFTDEHRTLNADLKLVKKNGTYYTGTNITVTAKVKSQNCLKLKNAHTNEELAYTLSYSTDLKADNTEQNLENITKDKPILTLPEKSQAVTNGTYTDTLSYIFSRQKLIHYKLDIK